MSRLRLNIYFKIFCTQISSRLFIFMNLKMFYVIQKGLKTETELTHSQEI
jgi:hypothetical protein